MTKIVEEAGNFILFAISFIVSFGICFLILIFYGGNK
jgi:hypothetical protein